MKNFLKSMMFALLGIFALASCEDVPAPYPIPSAGGNDGNTILTVDFLQGQGLWTTVDKLATTGVWTYNSQYGMVGSGYKNNANQNATSWLISPEIDLTKASKVKMLLNEAVNKIGIGEVSGGMTVWASTDGGENWTEIFADARPAGDSWNFQEDEFDLSAYDGKKIKLGFKYCSTTDYAGTWEIKGFKLQGKGEASIETPEEPLLTIDFTKGQGSWTTSDKGTLTGVWYNDTKYGMVATGYKNNQNNAAESWLISPEIDLTKASEVKMMLNEAINKIDADNGGSVESQMTVWATTNDGTTWNQVTASVRPAGSSWTFQEDEFDLSAYDGKKIKLGFKYLSTTSYTGTWEIKGFNLYGKGEASIEGGTDTPIGEATGTGTATDPYNVAAALGVIKGLQESTSASASYTSDEVYVKGRVSEIGKLGTSGGLIYYISDDGTTSNQLEIYYGNYLNGAAFTSASQLTLNDEVIVNGKLKNYRGTYEFDSGSKIVSLNGKTDDEGGGDEGGDEISTDPVNGITITSSQIANGGYGSVSLATNGYGSQAIATESTWYTFAVNKVGFTGCKICIATASNGGVIQMQGNASDASKQGFITNVTPFKPISTIKVTCRTTTSNQYAPDFHLYAGTATHPTGTAIAKPDSEPVTSGDFKIYTYTFDLSNGNYSYFTVANDTQGALYVDEIAITTK